MPYDQALDTESFIVTKEFEDTRLTVGVYSYNGGTKKLQLTRENRTAENDWRFAKMGRLSKEEVKEIIPIMMKAVESM